MAVSYVLDRSTSGSATTPYTTSAFTPTGTDRCLVAVVAAHSRNTADTGITGINFNTSEAFTQIGEGAYSGTGSDDIYVEMWYLVNPTSTSATCQFTFQNNNSTSAGTVCGVLAFNGVDQTTPIVPSSWATNSGESTAATVTSGTVTVTGGYALSVLSYADDSTMTESGTGSERFQVAAVTASMGGACASGPNSVGGGLWTSSYTLGVSDSWIMGVSLLQPPGAGPTGPFPYYRRLHERNR